MKDKGGYLILLFILVLILFACTLPAEGKRMPGEYVLDDGPVSVFFAGKFDNMNLYRMQDIEAGVRCYIAVYSNPSISCIFDPLTPRG